MSDLQNWEYSASVQRVKPMVVKWRSLTVELVDELYRAREALSNPRARTDLDSVSNVTQTWSRYLDDIGLNRMTVHRWLERYVPEERKLLTPEELEQRKAIQTRAEQDAAVARRERVNEALKTGKKPGDWDTETEKAYQAELKERAAREERIKANKEEMEAARIKREQDQAKRERESHARREHIDNLHIETEFLSSMIGQATEHHAKRREFKDRIRLSDGGKDDAFVDAIMDYLEELPDDNRRIEACTNIIKVARGISAQLQRGDG